MQKKKEKTVVIWSEGFPFKQNASNEKNSLIAKALIHAGYEVYITSKGSYGKNIKNEGTVNQIHYKCFSRNKVKLSIFKYLYAVLLEIRFLLSLTRKFHRVYLFGSYTSLIIYFFYSAFCEISKIRLVLNIMEWHINAHEKLSRLKRINSYFFDRFAFQLSAGTIAISDLIITNLKSFSNNSKYLFIPALTDVSKIDDIKRSDAAKFKYALYCGGIGYINVIETIIDAVRELGNDIHLVLVLHGKNSQLERVKLYISNIHLSDKIHIVSDLSYSDLINFYKNAFVLLVPLRDTIQDKARYPQKIAEYAACGRPIISNDVGQVGKDFSHKTDIYFANSYISTDLAKGIHEIFKNENLAKEIGKNARLKAEQYFDYLNYSVKLDLFLLYL